MRLQCHIQITVIRVPCTIETCEPHCHHTQEQQRRSQDVEISAGSAVPADLQRAIALAGEAVGSSDPGGEVVLQEIVGPAIEMDLDIVCEDVPNKDADRAPWMC